MSFYKELVSKLTKNNVCTNIYGLSNFESPKSISLAPLSELAMRTGGNIYNFTLGIDVNEERSRLREVLYREVNGIRAFNCAMRLRLSPGIALVDDT
jgi:hypothetical protein